MRHMDPRPQQTSPRVGVSLYGYLSSNVGLGVAARNTLHMLNHNEIPVRTVDVDSGAGAGDVNPAAVPLSRSAREGKHINVFHLNPDRLRYMIRPFSPIFTGGASLNAAVPFWEAPRLPRAWLDTLRAMDLILAPTRFVLDSIQADLGTANVVHYPQTVFIPDGVIQDRARWDLPTDTTAFVMSFAIASDVERKNPWGAIDAFLRAFSSHDGAMLVVKVNNPHPPGHGRHSLERLRELCRPHPHIRLVEQHLSYREVLSLYKSSDVLVSLHRAEGLGLNMLEAMALGVPVIATGWSGNMDFMTAENSIPVDFKLKDISVPETSPYHPSSLGLQTQWAEPNVDAAASAMRRLAQDPAQRARLAEAGRATAAASQARFLAGEEFFSAVASALRSTRPNVETQAAIRLLKRRFVADYARRIERGVRRRIDERLNT